MNNTLISSRLGDLGKVSMCKRVLKNQTTKTGEIPFYKISTFGRQADCFISKQLYEELRTKYSYPKKGDVLISAAGTVGETVVFDDKPGYFQDSNIVWIANDESKVLNSYLYYFFKTNPWLTTNGSTIKRIYNENLRSIKISYPKSIDKQKKVASVLSSLDEKIDCNNRIIIELEAIAKTLYAYWFVQFEHPDANDNPYKSSGGKMVYHPELNRDIPEGWKVAPLSDWIAADKTGDWGKDKSEGNYTLQVDCVRGADINGLNGTGSVSAPTRFILSKNQGKILAPFDFVVEISGGSPTQSTGRMSPITEETINRFSRPLICSNFCKAISLKDNSYFFNFSYLWKSAYDNKVLFGWEGKTSGIKNLLFDAFTSKHLVCTPPQKLAQRFFDVVSPLERKKQKLLKENDQLAALRDWLLPILMTGQVTVS